ncbi:MAG: holo-ACP synthase [Bacillota bacterium]|jgi:holo-[acyl-carrier protein] synthase
MLPDVRVGIDIVPIKRIEASLTPSPTRYLAKFLTAAEASYCQKAGGVWSLERVAGRIAAKEAVMKVLGQGWPRISWTHIEVLPGSNGRPRVSLSGEARTLSESLGMRDLDVSITHDGGFAVAAALGAFSQEVTSCSN